MNYTSIQLDISGPVAMITLDRPAKLNSLTPDMADEVRHALANTGVARAILLRGAGRAFCAGADLSTLEDGTLSEGAYRSLLDHYNPLIEDIVEHRLPIVSAVTGAAAGIGASLALACDFCIAAQSAYFLQSFANIGLVPDGGASWLLPRLVGKARAVEMMMLGEKVHGPRAVEWGLIHRSVEEHILDNEAEALAMKLANGPTLALGLMKANIAGAMDHQLAVALQAEAEAQREAAQTADAEEGIGAFFDRREACFKGC